MKPLIIGADHAGVALKKKLGIYFEKNNIPYHDVGSFDSRAQDDYPVYAKKVVKQVLTRHTKGVLICGSGTGMVMAANRHKGIRASLALDTYMAKMARYDNNANILVLRSRKFSLRKNLSILKTWLNTPFSKLPRHQRRIHQLDR